MSLFSIPSGAIMRTACNGDYLTLTCPEGHFITIISNLYGQSDRCNHGSKRLTQHIVDHDRHYDFRQERNDYPLSGYHGNSYHMTSPGNQSKEYSEPYNSQRSNHKTLSRLHGNTDREQDSQQTPRMLTPDVEFHRCSGRETCVFQVEPKQSNHNYQQLHYRCVNGKYPFLLKVHALWSWNNNIGHKYKRVGSIWSTQVTWLEMMSAIMMTPLQLCGDVSDINDMYHHIFMTAILVCLVLISIILWCLPWHPVWCHNRKPWNHQDIWLH